MVPGLLLGAYDPVPTVKDLQTAGLPPILTGAKLFEITTSSSAPGMQLQSLRMVGRGMAHRSVFFFPVPVPAKVPR